MVPAFCVQTQPQTPRRQEFLEWSFAFLLLQTSLKPKRPSPFPQHPYPCSLARLPLLLSSSTRPPYFLFPPRPRLPHH